MAQKIIEVVGTSQESFAKAAENAVAEAAQTVRGMKMGAGGGIRNGTGRQEDSAVPHHNKDLLRH
jgi:flavin-binding protein dodecin